MTDMIERVALALFKDRWPDDEWTPQVREDYRGHARAGIEAMREPTEKMIEASNREWDGRMSYRSSGAWQAMIDAALTGNREGETG